VPIDVVVPVYNKRRFLPESLGSIVMAAKRYGAATLWLVDNGSTDGSREFVSAAFSEVATLLTVRSGATIAEVRNHGAAQGRAPIICFFDCDCVVAEDHLVQLDRVLLEFPEAIVAGCKVGLPPSPTWVERTWNDLHDDGGDGERTYINSADLAARRSAFESVGGFDAALETGEDSEFCQRIRQAGGLVLQDQRLRVVHLDNAKTLVQFYRKERWRALGMFGTVSTKSIDKPTVVMALHLGFLLAALGLAASNRLSVIVKLLACAALVVAAPLAAVAHRMRSAVQPIRLGHALLLYELYFLARINALWLLLWRAARGLGSAREGGQIEA
jgi:GT2 family glycosyltransferase